MKAETWGARLLGVAMGATALLFGGCASAKVTSAESNPTKKSRCGIEGFTKSASEHIVVELERPFRVRTVEGVITSQGGDWPEGMTVLFELRPTNATGALRRAKTDSRGSFKIPDVPPGEYCFKATADGWQSVVGVVIVSKASDAAHGLRFEMPLGV